MNDSEMVILRILHIAPGVFWVGAGSLMAFVIEPALRNLGPSVQGPVMRRITPVLTPTMITAAATTIVMGLILVDRTPGRGFDQLFDGAWGWCMGVGLVTSLVAFGAGLLTARTARRMMAVAPAAGTPPTPEQQAAIGVLQARLRLSGRVNATLTLTAVVLMAAARFA